MIDRVLEALYPSSIYCISCGSIIDNTRFYSLCDDCMEKFHWIGKKTCVKCGKILADNYRHDRCYDCRTFTHDFEKGYTCVQYGLYERGLMMDYKFRKKSFIGRKLGDILYDRIRLTEIHPDLIVPIPMYAGKEAKMGFNQAAIMAGRLAEKMNVQYAGKLLIRPIDTLPLKGLGPLDRQENLRGAFTVSTSAAMQMEGKTVLLVDDIYTTGSTMDECSRVMISAGADKVYALSFAAGANRRAGSEDNG